MKIADVIIASLFIALSLLFAGDSRQSEYVVINTSNGEYRFPLNEDRVVSVDGPLGATVIEIKDHDAFIIDSPCPNKTCLYTRMGNTICCLPNHVLLTFEGIESEVDAYAY